MVVRVGHFPSSFHFEELILKERDATRIVNHEILNVINGSLACLVLTIVGGNISEIDRDYQFMVSSLESLASFRGNGSLIIPSSLFFI